MAKRSASVHVTQVQWWQNPLRACTLHTCLDGKALCERAPYTGARRHMLRFILFICLFVCVFVFLKATDFSLVFSERHAKPWNVFFLPHHGLQQLKRSTEVKVWTSQYMDTLKGVSWHFYEASSCLFPIKPCNWCFWDLCATCTPYSLPIRMWEWRSQLPTGTACFCGDLVLVASLTLRGSTSEMTEKIKPIEDESSWLICTPCNADEVTGL